MLAVSDNLVSHDYDETRHRTGNATLNHDAGLNIQARLRLMTRFLFNGTNDAEITILLAHGAGAPMDSASLNAIAEALAATGLRVARFEFGYMTARRSSIAKRPPPHAEALIPEYIAALNALNGGGTVVIGGKSMGGRVASMVADEFYPSGRIAGLLCLGYPFHPIGKPEQLRTAHLTHLQTPALIVQGTRDPFGTREEIASYKLSKAVEILWLEDGDHDLKPRKSVSGFTAADHIRTMADHTAIWAKRLAARDRQ